MTSNQFVHVIIENDSYDSNDKENVKVDNESHCKSTNEASTSRRKRIRKNVNKIWKKTTKTKKNKVLKEKNYDNLSNRKAKKKNEKKEIALMASSSLLAPSLSNDSSKSLVPFPTCSTKEYYRPPLSLNKSLYEKEKIDIKLGNSPRKRKTPTNDSNLAGTVGAKTNGALCGKDKISPKKLKTTTKVLTQNLSEDEERDFFPSCDDNQPNNECKQYTYLHDDLTSSEGDSDIFDGCEKEDVINGKETKNSGHKNKQNLKSPVGMNKKSTKYTSSDPVLYPPPPPPPPPPVSSINGTNPKSFSKKINSEKKNKGCTKPESSAKYSAPIPTIVVKKKGNLATIKKDLESPKKSKKSRKLNLYRKKIEGQCRRKYHGKGSIGSEHLDLLRQQSSSILDNDISDEDDISTLSCSKIGGDVDNHNMVDIPLHNEETQIQDNEKKINKNPDQNTKKALSPTGTCTLSSSSLHKPEITIGRADDYKEVIQNQKKEAKKTRKKEYDTYSSASFDSYSTDQSFRRNKRKKRKEQFTFFSQEYMNEVKNIAKQEWDNGITSAVNIVSQIKSRMADCLAPGVDMIHASPENKKSLNCNSNLLKPLWNQSSPPVEFIVCDDTSIYSSSVDHKPRKKSK